MGFLNCKDKCSVCANFGYGCFDSEGDGAFTPATKKQLEERLKVDFNDPSVHDMILKYKETVYPDEVVTRRDKTNYYLDIADVVSGRGTCLRRNYGAVIVSNDEVISTGYVGAPRGRENCINIGTCIRQKLQIPRGEQYEKCRSVHAEANAIISAERQKMIGADLYLSGKEINGEYVENACCCSMCKRLVINAGIKSVFVRNTADSYTKYDVDDWVYNDDSLSNNRGY